MSPGSYPEQRPGRPLSLYFPAVAWGCPHGTDLGPGRHRTAYLV